MKTIQLINILEGKTYPEAGTALFPYLVDAINEGERICIDMSGVDSIPTLFMNTSFGEVLLPLRNRYLSPIYSDRKPRG